MVAKAAGGLLRNPTTRRMITDVAKYTGEAILGAVTGRINGRRGRRGRARPARRAQPRRSQPQAVRETAMPIRMATQTVTAVPLTSKFTASDASQQFAMKSTQNMWYTGNASAKAFAGIIPIHPSCQTFTQLGPKVAAFGYYKFTDMNLTYSTAQGMAKNGTIVFGAVPDLQSAVDAVKTGFEAIKALQGASATSIGVSTQFKVNLSTMNTQYPQWNIVPSADLQYADSTQQQGFLVYAANGLDWTEGELIANVNIRYSVSVAKPKLPDATSAAAGSWRATGLGGTNAPFPAGVVYGSGAVNYEAYPVLHATDLAINNEHNAPVLCHFLALGTDPDIDPGDLPTGAKVIHGAKAVSFCSYAFVLPAACGLASLTASGSFSSAYLTIRPVSPREARQARGVDDAWHVWEEPESPLDMY